MTNLILKWYSFEKKKATTKWVKLEISIGQNMIEKEVSNTKEQQSEEKKKTSSGNVKISLNIHTFHSYVF